MAKQRYINTKFWDDKYIRSLGPNGKLLFLYFITSPLATISGAYELTIDHIHFHTDVPGLEIESWFTKFEADDKATFRDGWLLVHNTIDHQTLTNEKIRIGIEESLKPCPDWIKHILSIRYQELSHLNLNSDSDLNPDSNNGNAANAASDPVERRIWKDGIDLLAKSALTEKQARPLLGRLAKDYGKQELAASIAVTQAENPADPRPFLIGVLRQRAGIPDRLKSQVGASCDESPDYKCPTCFDTGEMRVPDGGISGIKWVPCTECKA